MHSGLDNCVVSWLLVFIRCILTWAGVIPTEKPSSKPERLGVAGLALHYAHIITQIDNIVSVIYFPSE